MFRNAHVHGGPIAYVQGSSCRDVESIFKATQRTLCKGICTWLFCCCIDHFGLLWLNLCINVGHWESCWECAVVAFVTEATIFGFGKEKYSIFCGHEMSKCKHLVLATAPSYSKHSTATFFQGGTTWMAAITNNVCMAP